MSSPWLYPRVKPTIDFPDIQTETLPDGSVLVHMDLDEEAILEALQDKGESK